MLHKFTCDRCGESKEYESDHFSGYGTNSKGEKICFLCCAATDKQYMRDTGKAILYLNWNNPEDLNDKKPVVTNWPGTLTIPCWGFSKGNHNIANIRYDVWFTFEGKEWHGVMYGNYTQICHCKRKRG